MKRFLSWKLLLLLIIIVAGFLRFYALDKIPLTLNPDEVSLGYSTFSLLNTAEDEHGKFLPIALQSFGDWKLPGYSYLDIVPMVLFGPNAFAVRSISALFGVIAVLAIYFIVFFLFKRKSIALLASFFYAISPWNIYFSRTAYEVNLATTLFLIGLSLFLKYLYENKKENRWITLSCIFFISTAFVQHAYIILSPLLVLGLVYLYKDKISWNKQILISFAIFVVFTIISFFNSYFLSTNKTANLLVFNDRNIIYNRSDKLKGDNAQKNIQVEKIIYNKFTGGLYQLGQNYVGVFSPSFFFDKGGEKLVDTLGYFANFYVFDALFIFVGFAGLFFHREKSTKVLLLWLVLAPIPAALTRNPLTATRVFTLLPLFIIMSAYGAYVIYNLLKTKNIKNYVIKSILLVIFVYNVILFMDGYFIHFNIQRIRFWRYGFEQSVAIANKYPEYNVVMRGPDNFPYIYFLFYNQYSPEKFKKEVKYYPPTNEGFYFVKSFGRYSFPWTIDYTKLRPKTIYFDDTKVNYRTNKIYLPSGEPILGYEVVN